MFKQILSIQIKWKYYLILLLSQIIVFSYFTDFQSWEYSGEVFWISLSISFTFNLFFIREILYSIKNKNDTNKKKWKFFLIILLISIGIIFNFYVFGYFTFILIYLSIFFNSISIIFFAFIYLYKKITSTTLSTY